MSRYVAFLRAVNVRGHAILSMKDLEREFSAAGCAAITTYGHAGNVIFDTRDRPARSVIRHVASRLSQRAGADVVIIARTQRDLARLARAGRSEPLAWDDARVKRYVAFLVQRPTRAPSLPVVSGKERLELVSISGDHAFVVSRPKPNRFYGIPNPFVEQVLGVRATTRNWSTVERICAMLTPAE